MQSVLIFTFLSLFFEFIALLLLSFASLWKASLKKRSFISTSFHQSCILFWLFQISWTEQMSENYQKWPNYPDLLEVGV